MNLFQPQYIWIGDKPSKRALANGWDWYSGRLAARSLFDAMYTIGLDPLRQIFVNAEDNPKHAVEAAVKFGLPVIAMGKRAQEWARQSGIVFISVVHPAARGSIRKKERYAAHLRDALGLKVQ